MKKNELTNKTREEILVMNSNQSKVICNLCIMLIVFMIASFLLLVYK